MNRRRATNVRQERMQAATALASSLLALLLLGCDRYTPTDTATRLAAQTAASRSSATAAPRVLVSILPQQFLVSRIAGDAVICEAVIARGGSEHSYEPTPQQIVGFGSARAYFAIHVPAEEGILRRIKETNSQIEVFDTTIGIPFRQMSKDAGSPIQDDGHDHAGHDHEGHDHSGDDPHIWLDPSLAAAQADLVCAGLSKILPEKKAEFETNKARLQADLARVDQEIQTLLGPYKGREFFVFHPSYGYFADRYGLRQSPVEFEGKEPTPRQLTALIERAKASGARVIFAQPQFATAPAEALATAIQGRIEVLDPLAPDYIENLRAMAGKIHAALRP